MRQLSLLLISIIAGMALTLAGYILAIVFLSGCAPAVHLTPQTTAKIEALQQDAAIAKEQAIEQAEKVKTDEQTTEQKVIANARIKTLQGQLSPVRHPFAATNNLVRELRPWLIAATIASGVIFALSFGLPFFFPSLTFLTPLRSWLRSIFILSGLSLLCLPFVPLLFYVVGGAALVLLGYELWRDKGNVKQAISDEAKLLGWPAPEAQTDELPPGKQVTQVLHGVLRTDSISSVPAQAHSFTPLSAPPATPPGTIAPGSH
jgi:hypothetical protein